MAFGVVVLCVSLGDVAERGGSTDPPAQLTLGAEIVPSAVVVGPDDSKDILEGQ